MAKKLPQPKKPRLRKALSLKEQDQAEQAPEPKVSKSSRLSSLNKLASLLGFVLRPLKKVLRLLMPSYFINAWRELRQVTWPTRIETLRLTGAVLVFAIVFGALVAGVDKILDEIFKKVILK